MEPGQMDLFAARNAAVEACASHAGDSWRAQAFALLVAYATTHERSLIENVRSDPAASFLPSLPDNRAWGAVAQQAVRERIVERVGYALARSSNLSPKPLWISLIYNQERRDG